MSLCPLLYLSVCWSCNRASIIQKEIYLQVELYVGYSIRQVMRKKDWLCAMPLTQPYQEL